MDGASFLEHRAPSSDYKLETCCQVSGMSTNSINTSTYSGVADLSSTIANGAPASVHQGCGAGHVSETCHKVLGISECPLPRLAASSRS